VYLFFILLYLGIGAILTIYMSTGVVESVTLTVVDSDVCDCTPRNICVMRFSVSLSSAYCSDINLNCCCHLFFTIYLPPMCGI